MKKSKRVLKRGRENKSSNRRVSYAKSLNSQFNFWKAAFLIFLLILLFVIYLKNSPVNLSTPGGNCEARLPPSNVTLIYNASHDDTMWVLAGYKDNRILCYNGDWYEAAPADSNWNWFITSNHVVSSCTQVGSWYIAQGSDVWNRGTLPGSCVPDYVLTCTNVDFNCDGKVDFGDENVFAGVFQRLFAEQTTLIQERDAATCNNLKNYLQNLLDRGETNLIFSENDALITKINECKVAGLIAHYSFNDSNANDIVGSKNGVVSGATFVDGKEGKAASFDGINDMINIPSFNGIAGKSFSVSFWTKPNFDYNDVNSTFTPAWISWLGVSSYFAIYQAPSNQTAFLMNTNNGNNWSYDTYRFSANEWLHVVGVYNKTSDKIRLYVDGKEATSGNGLGNGGLTGTASLVLGNAYNNYFKGIIDDLKIYDKALSLNEIVGLCGSDCVDEEKSLIYLTDSKWIGNFTQNSSGGKPFSVSGSSGLARADDICEKDSNKPNKQGAEFKALLGTSSRKLGGSDWVLKKNSTYYRPDGTLIGKTKNNSDWFEFPFYNSIAGSNVIVATGLEDDGSVSSDNCNSWVSGKSTDETIRGRSNAINSESIEDSSPQDCDEDYAIYCVEQIGGVSPPCISSFTQCTNWTNSARQCGTKVCTDINACNPNNLTRTDSNPCINNLCGNNVVDLGEDCDDNNTVSGDGCSSNCKFEGRVCGDGIILDANEDCDDDNAENEDGCSSTCEIEPGYVCNNEPSVCEKKTVFDSFWIYVVIIFIIVIAMVIVAFLIYKNMRSKHHGKGGVHYSPPKDEMRRPPGPGSSLASGITGEPRNRPIIQPMQARPSGTKTIHKSQVPKPPVIERK